MDLVSRLNVPCVGLTYSGYWHDNADLARFTASVPPQLMKYGAITIRCAPNKFDARGTGHARLAGPATQDVALPWRSRC